MTEKAGVAYLYLIICELCELCEQMCRLSIFSGKCLFFQEKLRTRNSAKYKPLGCLIEAIAAVRLLLLSPWPHYVPDKSRCTRAECTAMNAMAETSALAATAKAAKAAKAAKRLKGRR